MNRFFCLCHSIYGAETVCLAEKLSSFLYNLLTSLPPLFSYSPLSAGTNSLYKNLYLYQLFIDIRTIDDSKIEDNPELEFFNDNNIRKVWHSGEELSSKRGTICTPLQMLAPDGKMRRTQAANVEGILRIIQSISSPKAEPSKIWPAKVGAERLDEIADPERINR